MKKFSMILLVLLMGCKSVLTSSDASPLIYMKKTACMGTCPDYDISIFPNGKVVLNARQFIEKEGTFKAKISKEEREALIEAFESSGFDSFNNEYKSNRTDLPTTTISFNYEGKNKRIIDYDGAPKALKDLEAKVHALVSSLSWKEVK